MIPLTAKAPEPSIFVRRCLSHTSIDRRTVMNKLCVLTALAIIVCALSLQAQSQSQQSVLTVTESKLGKDVANREVVTETEAFVVNDRVYLWMKITGGPADSVVVTWAVDEYTWSTNLSVGASTWRTWAYKTAWKAGTWKVTVSDAKGNVLLEKSFQVTQ
jgi:hypothetical protein